jgi:hypothetical protein
MCSCIKELEELGYVERGDAFENDGIQEDVYFIITIKGEYIKYTNINYCPSCGEKLYRS